MSGIIVHTSGNRKYKNERGEEMYSSQCFIALLNVQCRQNKNEIKCRPKNWTHSTTTVKCSLKFRRVWKKFSDDLVIPEDTLLSVGLQRLTDEMWRKLWISVAMAAPPRELYTHLLQQPDVYKKKSISAEKLNLFTFYPRGGPSFNEALSLSCQGSFMMRFSQYQIPTHTFELGFWEVCTDFC